MEKIQIITLLCIYPLHIVAFMVLCPPRYKPSKTRAAWFGVFIACLLICTLLFTLCPGKIGQALSIPLTMIVILSALFYLSAYEPNKTLFVFLTYSHVFMVIVLASEVVVHFLFNDSTVVGLIIRTLLHAFFIVLCATVIRPRFERVAYGIINGWAPLNIVITLLLISVCILFIRAFGAAYGPMELLPFILQLLITVAVYWLFFNTIGYMHGVAVAQRLELQSKFLMEQAQAMEALIENARRIHHDVRHHNLQIAEYARNGELDELMEYLNQYEEGTGSKIPIGICENIAANSIMNAYAEKARQQGIDISFDAVVGQNIGIKDVDMVAILANIIENAIYGCVRSEKEGQFIKIQISQKSGKLIIMCQNTAGMVYFEGGLPKSEIRSGVGVSSIIHNAKKYDGEVDFQNINGVFTCRVLLPIKLTVC